MPRHMKTLLSIFDPYKNTKTQDHIDDLYMHLWMLEVRYEDVACRIFPFTLEGRAATWYQRLPVNLVHSWRDFKKLFLDKFADDKTPAMLLKELGNSKMGEKDKEKYFNQKLNHILKKFPPGT